VFEEGRTVWGTWAADDDLRRAVAVLSSAAPRRGADPEPVLLVCTHGLHDVCCAIRGRPVAAALATHWAASTWECSHVGGDRFAANLVVLPDGVYYGNLDPESAVEVVRTHLSGQVALSNLRGMTFAPPPAQAAIAAVHSRFGPFGPREVAVSAVEQTAGGAWEIRLTAPDLGLSAITATVTASRRAPAQLTCRAISLTPSTAYRVTRLDLENE
jgi:hypothetical protein